jgi:SAM-dependent methyltransferase
MTESIHSHGQKVQPLKDREIVVKAGGNKLNLGCGGRKKLKDFINIDREPDAKPDECFDIGTQYWPFAVDSVSEIRAHHILEHLTLEGFYHVLKEAYRVLQPDGVMSIQIPNVKHDVFWGDPEHIRPVTIDQLMLFNQQYWRDCIEERDAYLTPYWRIHKVDWEILHPINSVVDSRLAEQERAKFQVANFRTWNAVQEFHFYMAAKKPWIDMGPAEFKGEGYMRPEKREAMERQQAEMEKMQGAAATKESNLRPRVDAKFES